MLRPLTALRFGAALLVFPWHAAATRGIAMHYSLGYAGVTFFYVLSGFILTHTYGLVMEGGVTRRAVTRYAVARFARIYPVHLCAMLLTLAVLMSIGGDHWSAADARLRVAEVVSQVLLVQAWFPSQDVHFGVNGPAWSISVECFFYALFPLLLLGALRTFRSVSWRFVLCAAAAGWASFALVLLTIPAAFDQWNLYVFPPVRLIDFVSGMLLAVMYGKRTSAKLPVDATVAEAAALIGLALAAGCSVLTPQSLHFSAVFLPFCGFAIYVFALGAGRISGILSSPVAVRLGEASYAFYLLHLNVIHVVEHLLHGRSSGPAFAVALALSILLALAAYSGLEAPLRRRIRDGWEQRAGWRPDAQARILPAGAGTSAVWQRYSATAETRFP